MAWRIHNNPLQRGRLGNLGVSQKVRVFTIPEVEAVAMIDRGEKPPERVANALYLEWFSKANGRVLIESVDFKLKISPPEWRMTPAEEGQRAADVEAGWHLDKSQAGLEAVAPKKLLPEKMVTEARQDLFEIREGILEVDGPVSPGEIGACRCSGGEAGCDPRWALRFASVSTKQTSFSSGWKRE